MRTCMLHIGTQICVFVHMDDVQYVYAYGDLYINTLCFGLIFTDIACLVSMLLSYNIFAYTTYLKRLYIHRPSVCLSRPYNTPANTYQQVHNPRTSE